MQFILNDVRNPNTPEAASLLLPRRSGGEGGQEDEGGTRGILKAEDVWYIRNKRRSKGFTLIELMIVVGVIGILSAIVIIAINPSLQLGKAGDAKRRSDARELQQALYQYLIGSPQHDFPDPLPDGASNKKPICKQSMTEVACHAIPGGGVWLDELVSDYLPAIPFDESETVANRSGYEVYQEVGRAVVISTHLPQ